MADTHEALMRSGAAHYKAKEFDAAIADFTTVIEGSPKNAAAWYNRGCVYYSKGDRVRAFEDWERAAALAPGNAKYQETLKKTRAAAGGGKPAAANDDAVYSKAEVQRNVLAHCRRGSAYLEGKNYNDAIKEFTEAIHLDPNFVAPYVACGMAYLEDKNYDAAIEKYTEAIDRDKNLAEAYFGRGTAYQFKKDHGQAVENFEKVIKIDPKNALAYSSLGISLVDTGKPDQAMNEFNKAIDIDRNLAPAYFGRGELYKSKGDYDSAIRDMETAVRIASDNPVLRENSLAGFRESLTEARLEKERMTSAEKIDGKYCDEAVKIRKDGDTGPAGGLIFSVNGHFCETAPVEYEFKQYSYNADRICKRIKINGIKGWRLPTIEDLAVMHQHLKEKGFGHFKNTDYLSNTGVRKKDCGYDNNRCGICETQRIHDRGSVLKKYNPDDFCANLCLFLNFGDGIIYRKPPPQIRDTKYRVRPVRDVTEEDQAIADSHRGESFNPYKTQKRTMIGLGIAAVILGFMFAGGGHAGIGLVGMIAGVVVLVKGIKF